MAIQDKFNKPNVIYKITKDIDLKGETLTIPEGCTLDFQGGSFLNGTIVGDSTAIKAGLERIFNTNIGIGGTWRISQAYPEWFGANITLDDNSVYIQKTIDSFNNIQFGHGTYKIKTPITVRKRGVVINGAGRSNTAIMKMDGTKNEYDINAIIHINTGEDYNYYVTISNITLSAYGYNVDFAIHANKLAISKIDSVHTFQCRYGIYLTTNWQVSISNCEFNANTRKYGENQYGYNSATYGVYSEGSGSTSLYITKCWVRDGYYGYHFYGIHHAVMNDCGADNLCNTAYHIYYSEITINGCGAENIHIGSDSHGLIDIQQGRVSFFNFVSKKIYAVGSSASIFYMTFWYNTITQLINCSFESWSDITNWNSTFNYRLKENAFVRSIDSALPTNGNSFLSDMGGSKIIIENGAISRTRISNDDYHSRTTAYPNKGITGKRPTLENVDECKGFNYFDTTLNKPIWWTGTAWVDATGVTV